MSTFDILISALVALVVNLTTPLVQKWLKSLITSLKARANSASVSVLLKRKNQLEEDLKWFKETSEPKQFLQWLVPNLFTQIFTLWFLVLLSLVLYAIQDISELPEAFSKGVLYGWIGMGTRYFFTFILTAKLAVKALKFSETEKKINQQIIMLETLIDKKRIN